MNVKRLVFWGAVFGVLLLYVLLFERQETEKEQKPSPGLDKIFSIARPEIKGLQIIQDGNKVTLLKKERKWQITFPPNVQVRNELIESLVSAILDTVNIKVIDQNPADLSQYGLDHPGTELSIFLERKSKPVTLLIGGNTPTSVSMYVMIKGESSVILAGTYLRFSINSFLQKIRQ